MIGRPEIGTRSAMKNSTRKKLKPLGSTGAALETGGLLHESDIIRL